MKSELTIAKIVKPRGLKGEVKTETYSDDPKRFSVLKKVRIDADFYSVQSISVSDGFAYFKLEGVESVEQAEALRGKYIIAKRDDLPSLPDGRYYIADLKGMDVYVGGEKIGELQDVAQYGSADVYVIKGEKCSLSVPLIKGLLKNVDLKGGIIELDDRLFDRVAVFN
jgi:16S rRNA processing protein RimM